MNSHFSKILKNIQLPLSISNFVNIGEHKIKAELYEKPFRLTILLFCLLMGLIPLSFDLAIKATSGYQSKKQLKIQNLLEEADIALNEHNEDLAIKYYKEVFNLNKNNIQANFELANYYIFRNRLSDAEIYIQNLYKNKADSSYFIAIDGFKNFQQKKYIQAEKLLKQALDQGLEQVHIKDYLGASLLINKKSKLAFSLAGWPLDCQVNSLAHADCMNKLANWYSKIIINDENLSYREHQLIYAGESLRSLIVALREVNGIFRLELIKKYERQRKELTMLYANYALRLHLSKEKLKLSDLTKKEKQIHL